MIPKLVTENTLQLAFPEIIKLFKKRKRKEKIEEKHTQKRKSGEVKSFFSHIPYKQYKAVKVLQNHHHEREEARAKEK